jgi:hypothetical protein
MRRVASPVTNNPVVPFPIPQNPTAPTRLVTHWLKDPDGKLYQMWVRENIKP